MDFKNAYAEKTNYGLNCLRDYKIWNIIAGQNAVVHCSHSDQGESFDQNNATVVQKDNPSKV